MHIPRMFSSLATCLALTMACAHNPAPDGVETAMADRNAPIAVEVENHGWADATIYLVSGGLTRRVGMVTGSSSQSFTVPATYIGTMGEFQLKAHQIGSPGSLTTDVMTIQPGQMIKFTVENHLANSSYGVY
ncbi:MAG TPA: hypothetical protein VFS33_06755 [Gemmatimonadales bacterium]|nr:hypothetical protein [Gemmatimonadales bacterium]